LTERIEDLIKENAKLKERIEELQAKSNKDKVELFPGSDVFIEKTKLTSIVHHRCTKF